MGYRVNFWKTFLQLINKFQNSFQRRHVNNYEKFVQLMSSYCSSVGYPTQIEKNLSEISVDTTKTPPWSFVSNHFDLKAVSMDDVAQNVIRNLYYIGTTKIDESPASADAFLIDSNGFWYFIEFKNQDICSKNAKKGSKKSVKEKCIEKSYATIYWLLKILEDLKKERIFSFSSFEPNSKDIEPLDFVKKYCKYILVLGNPDHANDNILQKIKNAKLAKIPSSEVLPFLKKLSSYVFNSADVYGCEQFDNEFVKNFKYE